MRTPLKKNATAHLMPSLSLGRDMPQPSVDDEAFARRGRIKTEAQHLCAWGNRRLERPRPAATLSRWDRTCH